MSDRVFVSETGVRTKRRTTPHTTPTHYTTHHAHLVHHSFELGAAHADREPAVGWELKDYDLEVRVIRAPAKDSSLPRAPYRPVVNRVQTVVVLASALPGPDGGAE